MRKKKVLIQSDFSLAKTGFGRNAKAILSHLYKTGKYELVHYCGGMNYSNPQLLRTPWKSVGSLPDDQQEINRLNQDQNLMRAASYGSYYIDRVIQEEKPDTYIAIQDIWGVDFAIDKPWFNKINSAIWTTLDSLPTLPTAIEAAKKTKNYWVWSNFAEKDLHKLGHKHVKTVHGSIDSKYFYKLENHKRKELRKRFGINEKDFIIGFVFRNQLRKSVPNLLEGFKLFKERNRGARARLLLHTHFGEGWNIIKLANEYQIAKEEILTTYICKSCGEYEIKPFDNQDIKCRFCSAEKGQTTTNVSIGVSEAQLNDVYNMMDVYCHPFTSGGQEIPIQEAKLTELITLVTNYSCGEEMCEPEANSLPLEWSEYREHGTEFKKASTCPVSIAKQLQRVFTMPEAKKREMEKKAREWTINGFSTESVGKILEDFIDSGQADESAFVEAVKEKKDPSCVIPVIEDNSAWLTYIYLNILKMAVDENDSGHKYWMGELGKGMPRGDIEKYFRDVARKDSATKQIDFGDTLDKNDAGKRLLYVMPESIGDVFMSTALFESMKQLYPEYNLYVATKPENAALLEGNPYVYRVIPYIAQMDNLLWLEGAGDHKGYFEIAFLPYVGTQKILDYVHNAQTKIAFEIKD